MAMRIEYHRTLMADRVRNQAFHAALKALIVPGETTVADIGAGTGFLGLLAAKLGAREVFLYEKAEVAGVAQEILRRNRARKCTLFPFASTEVDDPPRVDLVVSETLGNYALEEDIAATMNDARRRHLKSGGCVIPAAIAQHVAPVISPRVHSELAAWDAAGFGLDLTPAKAMSFNNAYVRSFAGPELLDGGRSAKVWDQLDFSRENRPSRKGDARWLLRERATVYGFALWWTAELARGVALSTAPDAPRTHWEQLYLPLIDPIAVKAAESLALTIRSRSSPEAGTHLAWTALALDRAGKPRAKQSLDLNKGFLP